MNEQEVRELMAQAFFTVGDRVHCALGDGKVVGWAFRYCGSGMEYTVVGDGFKATCDHDQVRACDPPAPPPPPEPKPPKFEMDEWVRTKDGKVARVFGHRKTSGGYIYSLYGFVAGENDFLEAELTAWFPPGTLVAEGKRGDGLGVIDKTGELVYTHNGLPRNSQLSWRVATDYDIDSWAGQNRHLTRDTFRNWAKRIYGSPAVEVPSCRPPWLERMVNWAKECPAEEGEGK